MEHGTAPELVTVDAARLRELTYKYVEYRQSLTSSMDPVQVLNLTGDVLEAVRRVIKLPPAPYTHTPKGQPGHA